jgi:hypothetical protein
MIYKVEVGDQTYTEAETCFIEKIINMHIAQGHEENGDIKYTHFINFSLNKRECEELIKSLQMSLTDLIDYSAMSIDRLNGLPINFIESVS